MCNEANITVVDVDYRMGPEFKFPTATYDCWDTIKWVSRICVAVKKLQQPDYSVADDQ